MASTLQILRRIRSDHQHGSKILDAVRNAVRCCEDRTEAEWAIAAALYWVSVEWHGGQGCALYLGQCGDFTPGPSHRSIADEEDFIATDLHAEIMKAVRS